VQLAPHWETAAAAVAVLAVAAKAARAVTWSGAAAGLAVGLATAAGFGAAGLAVLGAFFVVGSVATKAGYATKAARGAAEKRGGARGWENVVGKGGVAALIALLAVADASPFDALGGDTPRAFAGALSAALADTLGTEIGTLARGAPRGLPLFRPVPTGTPGAVSLPGTLAGAAGAALVALVASGTGLNSDRWDSVVAVAGAGVLASLGESLAVGLGLRAPGFVRNVLTTALGALAAGFAFRSVL
jgi:uncharacterized protein (TIGR00297 family)